MNQLPENPLQSPSQTILCSADGKECWAVVYTDKNGTHYGYRLPVQRTLHHKHPHAASHRAHHAAHIMHRKHHHRNLHHSSQVTHAQSRGRQALTHSAETTARDQVNVASTAKPGVASAPSLNNRRLPPPSTPASSHWYSHFGWRLPDFYSGSVSVAIPNPLTLSFVGITGNVNVDRYGHLYLGIGPSVGKSATLIAGSVTANWLNRRKLPTQSELNGFMTKHSLNVGGGFIGGVQETWSPGSGTATGIGIFSPQIGGGYSYSWDVHNFSHLQK